MRRARAATWLGVLSVAVWSACGPPIDPNPDPDPDPIPPECAPSECDPPAGTLWPMKVGSTWTYEIDDPIRGRSEKVVRVERTEVVPGTQREAALFISVQDHLTEHSWQVEEDGLAKRVREEDYKQGQRVRTATWSPLTIKALTAPQAAGWENRIEVIETLTDEHGVTDDKHKVFIWRVLETDVPVEVNGTQMRAIKIHREREDKDGKDRTYWLVPGVGKVREEGERTEVLQSFSLPE